VDRLRTVDDKTGSRAFGGWERHRTPRPHEGHNPERRLYVERVKDGGFTPGRPGAGAPTAPGMGPQPSTRRSTHEQDPRVARFDWQR
jgi:hypothetical protein